MGKKLDKVLEGYKPIPSQRMYYPRSMNLSEDFVTAFHREYDRLIDEGQNPKRLLERFSKALRFHATEERKYKKLEEDNTGKQRQQAVKKLEDKHRKHRERQEGKQQAREAGFANHEEDEDVKEEGLPTALALGAAGGVAGAVAKKATEKLLDDDDVEEEDCGKKHRRKKQLHERNKKRKKGGNYGVGDSHAGDGDSD